MKDASSGLDSLVFGTPILRYEAANRFRPPPGLGPTFMRQDYAFALPLNSPLRKAINGSLLCYITTGYPCITSSVKK